MQVILPHTHFSQDEIEALQESDTVHEALAMRDSHKACFEVRSRTGILQLSQLWVCIHAQ